mmetsp:Transcript_70922/g.207828  ORF Transcript_70922/g.207828 Transcript_70922/m.207828 type:complete len:200 (-) Transcript_70922:1178-1777(-)
MPQRKGGSSPAPPRQRPARRSSYAAGPGPCQPSSSYLRPLAARCGLPGGRAPRRAARPAAAPPRAGACWRWGCPRPSGSGGPRGRRRSRHAGRRPLHPSRADPGAQSRHWRGAPATAASGRPWTAETSSPACSLGSTPSSRQSGGCRPRSRPATFPGGQRPPPARPPAALRSGSGPCRPPRASPTVGGRANPRSGRQQW